MATLSTGKHRYFLQVEDNTMVFDAEAIDTVMELLGQAFGERTTEENQLS